MSKLITWTDGGTFYGGVVGGDGAGTAWSRRFTAPLEDGTFAVIDVSHYPVDVAQRYGEDVADAGLIDVETQTNLTICTHLEDIGGTEVWSEVDYDDPLAMAYDTEAAAIAYCKSAAESESADNYGDPADWR